MTGYDGKDRRAKAERDRMQEQSGWHLDKKVPISLIFTMLLQVCVVIWVIADMKKDIELLKADVSGLHTRDIQITQDFRDAVRILQDQFQRMDSKLDRLIERPK